MIAQKSCVCHVLFTLDVTWTMFFMILFLPCFRSLEHGLHPSPSIKVGVRKRASCGCAVGFVIKPENTGKDKDNSYLFHSQTNR